MSGSDETTETHMGSYYRMCSLAIECVLLSIHMSGSDETTETHMGSHLLVPDPYEALVLHSSIVRERIL